MRSSRVVRVSGCQCQSRNTPGFDPSILRYGGILGAADEAVLNAVHKTRKKIPIYYTKVGWFMKNHYHSEHLKCHTFERSKILLQIERATVQKEIVHLEQLNGTSPCVTCELLNLPSISLNARRISNQSLEAYPSYALLWTLITRIMS
jgi:hypothetical protein